jgi:hypothetical protein
MTGSKQAPDLSTSYRGIGDKSRTKIEQNENTLRFHQGKRDRCPRFLIPAT